MKNVIITVLSIAVIILGGYLVYDKIIEKDDKKVENNDSKENTNLDDSIAREFIDEIIDSNVFNILDKLSENGLSEENKLSLAINKTSEQTLYTCSGAFNMNNEGEYRSSSNAKWGCSNSENISSYIYNSVNEQYKKLFGSLNNAKKIGIYTTTVYEYSNKIDSYVKLTPYFGPIVSNDYYYNIESAKISGDKLDIEISYLGYKPVTLGSETEFSYELNGNVNEFNINEISTVFNNNKDLLPHLTFSYEKENENYILKSVNQ